MLGKCQFRLRLLAKTGMDTLRPLTLDNNGQLALIVWMSSSGEKSDRHAINRLIVSRIYAARTSAFQQRFKRSTAVGTRRGASNARSCPGMMGPIGLRGGIAIGPLATEFLQPCGEVMVIRKGRGKVQGGGPRDGAPPRGRCGLIFTREIDTMTHTPVSGVHRHDRSTENRPSDRNVHLLLSSPSRLVEGSDHD